MASARSVYANTSLVWWLASVAMIACSEVPDGADTHVTQAGGTVASGGLVVSGGVIPTGGVDTHVMQAGGAVATGGLVASGGVIPTGGAVATGGTAGTGGMAATGGIDSTGGALGTGGSSQAGGMSGSGGMDATGGTGGTGTWMLPPTADYAAPGPFSTVVEADVGPGRNFTIFRPETLGEHGFVHSPIIFGPGILTSASLYTALLTHLASHGFVTICVNSLSGGPNDAGNLRTMTEGLNWLLERNSEAGDYQDKLAIDRAITMGYSIGATASTQLSSHPAIMTTVSIHGHATSADPHGPVLLITGTSDVIDGNRETLATLDEAPAMLVALPIGHLDVLTELAMTADISDETRYIAPITAWLRYWAYGDENAKGFLWGADCHMCTSPWITPETNRAWTAQTL